eukprot:COSAG02_NODE_2320_length_9141_cov_5.148087_4_plen_98_part_00
MGALTAALHDLRSPLCPTTLATAAQRVSVPHQPAPRGERSQRVLLGCSVELPTRSIGERSSALSTLQSAPLSLTVWQCGSVLTALPALEHRNSLCTI